MDVATLHSPRHQDPIRLLHQISELLFWSLLHNRVVRDLAVAAPANTVNEVSAEDHAHVIELKSLRCVDATDLIDSVGIGGPEVRLRDAWRQLARIGHAEPIQPEVVHQLARAVRVRPGRTEAGDKPGTVPSSVSGLVFIGRHSTGSEYSTSQNQTSRQFPSPPSGDILTITGPYAKPEKRLIVGYFEFHPSPLSATYPSSQ
jgi:hypothetical protein